MGNAAAGGAGGQSDFERTLRVLMRFGLDQQSITQVKEALVDQGDDLKDLQAQWEMLRRTAGLTEAETVKAIQGSVTGMKLKEDQILAIGKAYEAERAAAATAADAESANLAKIEQHTALIAQSFTNAISAGRAISEMGRAGTIFGQIFNNEDLKTMGMLTVGAGELVMVMGRLPALLKEIQSLGGIMGSMGVGGAAAAGATAAATAAATAGVVLLAAQTLSAVSEGLKANQGLNALSDTQRRQFGTQYRTDLFKPMDQGIASFGDWGARAGKLNADLEEFKKQEEAAGKETEKTTEKIRHATIELSAANAGIDVLSGILNKLGASGAAAELQKLFSLSPQMKDAAKQYQDYQQQLIDIDKEGAKRRAEIEKQNQDRIADMTQRFTQANVKAYQDFVDANTDAAEQFRKQQMKIAAAGIDEEAATEKRYYQDRAKQAASFGIEMLRLEQDHQIELQRMQEDHGIKLRHLAESRDALAIEDENESYEISRRRNEEDYQKEVARRSEDYARQLAEQEAAFAEQRAARQDDRAKQLAELQQEYNEQKAKRAKAYADASQEREKQFSDELNKQKTDGATRLAELDGQLRDERQKATDQWTDWRREHGLFLAGEKQLWDDYLQYTYDQLQKYLGSTTAPGLDYGSDVVGGIHSHDRGGYQTYTGLARMHAGEFVSNPDTTRALEHAAGGTLTQEKLLALAARGGSTAAGMSISISQSFSGQESTPENYRRIVIDTVTDLFRRARQ